MNSLKILVLGLFLIASSYALFTSMARKVDPNNIICENAISRLIASWSAGCYYSVYFDESDSIDNKRLDFERNKLEVFARRGGVSPEILWYRLKFHQRYQRIFRTNFQDLHYMYMDYTKSQHILLERQVDYLYFLQSNELLPLAQQTLNNFCDTYILTRRKTRIEDLQYQLDKKDVSLSIEHCNTDTH